MLFVAAAALSRAASEKPQALAAPGEDPSYAPAVEQLCDVVAELDVLVALAHVASNAPTPYVRPALSAAGEGDLVLREARHPCVEMMDDVAFIANDVELRRKDARLQVVTGPNMGGKSTYIRQAGVIELNRLLGA